LDYNVMIIKSVKIYNQ